MTIEVVVYLQEQFEVGDFMRFLQDNQYTCTRMIVLSNRFICEVSYTNYLYEMVSYIQETIHQNYDVVVRNVPIKLNCSKAVVSIMGDVIIIEDKQVPLHQKKRVIDIKQVVDDEQVYTSFNIILELLRKGTYVPIISYFTPANPEEIILPQNTLSDLIVDNYFMFNQIAFSKEKDAYVLDKSIKEDEDVSVYAVRQLMSLLNFSPKRLLGVPSSHIRFYLDESGEVIHILSRTYADIGETYSIESLLSSFKSGVYGTEFRKWILYLFFKYKRFIEYTRKDEIERNKLWKLLLKDE